MNRKIVIFSSFFIIILCICVFCLTTIFIILPKYKIKDDNNYKKQDREAIDLLRKNNLLSKTGEFKYYELVRELPNDIPIYKNSNVLWSSYNKGILAVAYKLEDVSTQNVYDFYKSKLSNSGWQLDKTLEEEERKNKSLNKVILATKDDKKLQITILFVSSTTNTNDYTMYTLSIME